MISEQIKYTPRAGDYPILDSDSGPTPTFSGMRSHTGASGGILHPRGQSRRPEGMDRMARNTVKHQPQIFPPPTTDMPSGDGSRWFVASLCAGALFVGAPMAVSNPNSLQDVVIGLCAATALIAGIWAWKWESLNRRFGWLRTISGIWIPRLIGAAVPFIVIAIVFFALDLVERMGLLNTPPRQETNDAVAVPTEKLARLLGQADYRRIALYGKDGKGGLKRQIEEVATERDDALDILAAAGVPASRQEAERRRTVVASLLHKYLSEHPSFLPGRQRIKSIQTMPGFLEASNWLIAERRLESAFLRLLNALRARSRTALYTTTQFVFQEPEAPLCR